MRINLIAIGKRMPDWVANGFNEYAKRLTQDCQLQLIEVEAEKRLKNADLTRLLNIEGERMLAAIPKNSRVISLDMRGKQWDTPTLAMNLQHWQLEGRDMSLLIGGPEGLAPACLSKAEQNWSLSLLTLPHPLVRVIVAEQIYRAWSLLHKHPYHR